MYDIHCHILPGVDDGSGNLNDSIEMAQLAAESGVKGIVATPHCNIPGMFRNYKSEELEATFRTLQAEIKRRELPIALYLGQEIFLCQTYVQHLKKGDLITLNNSRYMLVEFDFKEEEGSALSKIANLVSCGYTPIIAHPERYGFVIENFDAIKRIRSLGGLVQINKGSLLGEFGPYISRTAKDILISGQADFVASDAHSQYDRTPNLADVDEMLCETVGYDYADILLNTNPKKVLDNEKILNY